MIFVWMLYFTIGFWIGWKAGKYDARLDKWSAEQWSQTVLPNANPCEHIAMDAALLQMEIHNGSLDAPRAVPLLDAALDKTVAAMVKAESERLKLEQRLMTRKELDEEKG